MQNIPTPPKTPEDDTNLDQFEVIDSTELAKRLNVPESWIRSRSNPRRTNDPIPHLRFGRYVRFSWGSHALRQWLDRQQVSTNSGRSLRRIQ